MKKTNKQKVIMGDYFLAITPPKLPRRNRHPGDAELREWYQAQPPVQYISAIIHAARTQGRGAFLLTRENLAEIGANNPNIINADGTCGLAKSAAKNRYKSIIAMLARHATVTTTDHCGVVVEFEPAMCELLGLDHTHALTEGTRVRASLRPAAIAGPEQAQPQTVQLPAEQMPATLQAPQPPSDEALAAAIWDMHQTNASEWRNALEPYGEETLDRVWPLLKAKANDYWRKNA